MAHEFTQQTNFDLLPTEQANFDVRRTQGLVYCNKYHSLHLSQARCLRVFLPMAFGLGDLVAALLNRVDTKPITRILGGCSQ